MSFVHLHAHTEYSLLDGSNKIKEYCARVKELGQSACAITDHGAMYGVIHFYKECKKNGIKPIIGCEVYVAPSSRFDKDANKGEDKYSHLILLAENNEGYHNLLKIVSHGFTEGFYYKPRVDKDLLRKYSKGIIASSACLAGEIPKHIIANQYESAKETIREYQEIFGKDNFFLELQDHGILNQKIVNKTLISLSEETGAKLIATNDIHYTNEEDATAHDILICIQTNAKVEDTNRMRYEGGQYYIKSEEEMREIFSYAPQAIENTARIADRCNVEIVFGEKKLPKYNIPNGYDDAYSYLKYLCLKGLDEKYRNQKDIAVKRLEYELDIIKKMGFIDYFLIVWDFINYARANNIPVGPGRGSAAGSIVSYTLGITNIDPFRYQLIFERFLNPDRVSMPDIDIDFCYERRQEVIDYVIDKYGEDQVSQIITFGTLQARGVVRDVTRVLDLPYIFGDRIAKKIPMQLGMTLDTALSVNPELREEYDTNQQVKEVIDVSRKLEGLPRHASRHAAGVLISNKPVEEYVPLALTKDGAVVEQFDMVTLEELGLLKMDFLGLRTLTVIKDTIDNVKRYKGVDIDIDKLNLDDENVYKLISSGETDGVFQLESAGMRNFMKELKPETIDDIIAGIALYRPGPMDFIPKYINGKNNKNNIKYDTPQLESILKSTYGCIVYQEQVMQIVQELAGFPMGRSDELRRAMSKKKQQVMENERKVFVYGDEKSNIPGCINNGIDEKVANKIYDEMIDFAKYAFNKSHAAAYAYISYQTAYLKYYYTEEFMAALLTSVTDNSTKLTDYIYVCKANNISILQPDINKSENKFVINEIEDSKEQKSGIRFSLPAIKSVGSKLSENIIEEREKNGGFKSVEDFVVRTKVNSNALSSFIFAGAFDNLGYNRRTLYYALDDIMKCAKKETNPNQLSLLDAVSDNEHAKLGIKIVPVDEYSKSQKLELEKSTTGTYISGHPLEDYIDIWDSITNKRIADILDDDISCNDKKIIIAGQVLDFEPHITKNGKNMAFFKLEDLSATVNIILFPNEYIKYKDLVSDDSKIIIEGVETIEENKDPVVKVTKIKKLKIKEKTLWLRYSTDEDFNNNMIDLEDIAKGDERLIIYIENTKEKKIYSNINIDDELIAKSKNLLGNENVKVVEK